jgi:hypothetical protein
LVSKVTFQCLLLFNLFDYTYMASIAKASDATLLNLPMRASIAVSPFCQTRLMPLLQDATSLSETTTRDEMMFAAYVVVGAARQLIALGKP